MTMRPALPATEDLEQLRERFAHGDHWALVHALQLCAATGQRLPDWLAAAWHLRLTAAADFAVESWDDLLPPIKPKGRKVSALRRQQRWAELVALAVYSALRRGASIQPDLFAELTERERWPFSGATASKVYYTAQKVAPEPGNDVLRAIFEGIERVQASRRSPAQARALIRSTTKRRKTL